MRGWTIADRGIAEKVLKEKRILAQPLNRLDDCQPIAYFNVGDRETDLDHQITQVHRFVVFVFPSFHGGNRFG